jgi:hypothetical protein
MQDQEKENNLLPFAVARIKKTIEKNKYKDCIIIGDTP